MRRTPLGPGIRSPEANTLAQATRNEGRPGLPPRETKAERGGGRWDARGAEARAAPRLSSLPPGPPRAPRSAAPRRQQPQQLRAVGGGDLAPEPGEWVRERGGADGIKSSGESRGPRPSALYGPHKGTPARDRYRARARRDVPAAAPPLPRGACLGLARPRPGCLGVGRGGRGGLGMRAADPVDLCRWSRDVGGGPLALLCCGERGASLSLPGAFPLPSPSGSRLKAALVQGAKGRLDLQVLGSSGATL